MNDRVFFHPLAIVEYRSAIRWYATQSLIVKAKFKDRVDVALDRVASDYETLPWKGSKHRWIRVVGFPYILIVREVSELKFVVIAVSHTIRKPGYWKGRKPKS